MRQGLQDHFQQTPREPRPYPGRIPRKMESEKRHAADLQGIATRPAEKNAGHEALGKTQKGRQIKRFFEKASLREARSKPGLRTGSLEAARISREPVSYALTDASCAAALRHMNQRRNRSVSAPEPHPVSNCKNSAKNFCRIVREKTWFFANEPGYAAAKPLQIL